MSNDAKQIVAIVLVFLVGVLFLVSIPVIDYYWVQWVAYWKVG